MAGYNRTREVEELLERTESLPPSFTVHLHLEYWTLNNGSKFLYNNQIASLLDDIRAHRIPVDFLEIFDSARVPFYDGCMVVELLDYRPQKNRELTPETPERTRAILHPDSETLWADICSLNQKYGSKWTDDEALRIEAQILLATSPPLCLEPNPHLTRIANHVLRVSTPTVPVSLKRKAAALDPEEDETDKARRSKIMQFMNPGPNRSHAPSYRILDAIQRSKQAKEAKDATTQPQVHQNMALMHQPPPPQTTPTPVPNFAQASSPASSEDLSKKKLKQKKKDVPQSPYMNDRANTQTPVAPPATHQFNQQNQNSQNSQQSPSPSAAQSPLQPQVFANVQAATESAKRTPTPARQQYSQSPQVPPSQPPPVVQPPSHPQPPPRPAQPHPPSLPTFQPAVPTPHFLHQPPQGTRNAQAKPSASTNTPQPSPQQANIAQANAQNAAQAHALYAHHLQQTQHLQQAALASQQRLNPAQQTHNGRVTPQAPPISRSPMNANQNAAQRGSPMATTQPLASRSPVPPNTQQVPQMAHPPQHANYQFNPAHLRPAVHGNPSPHPQALPAHLTNTGSQGSSSPIPARQQPTPSQDPAQPHQQPMMQYPPMFYPQMPMNFAMQPGRAPPAYWQMGMGRGIPGVVNGQPVTGMPPNAHPQQMPLNVGKAVPGGLPGR